MLTTSPSKLYLKESQTNRGIPPTCRTPHRASRPFQGNFEGATAATLPQETITINDASVKKIVVPPNGTGLDEMKGGGAAENHIMIGGEQREYYTFNAEKLAENMVNKGSNTVVNKQRPPSSAEASRFSQRIHSVHHIKKDQSSLSKQISELTKTNSQPFQVLPSKRTTQLAANTDEKSLPQKVHNLNQAQLLEQPIYQQNEGGYNRQNSLGGAVKNTQNTSVKPNYIQQDAARVSGTQWNAGGNGGQSAILLQTGIRRQVESGGAEPFSKNRYNKDGLQLNSQVSSLSVVVHNPQKVASSRERFGESSKGGMSTENGFNIHRQYMQNMGIQKMSQQYVGGHSQTLSGLGQVYNTNSFNTLEDNIVLNYASENHSASPQKRLNSGKKELVDLANISGNGLYQHTNTGMGLISDNLTVSKETLPFSSDTFSGRRSVDGNNGPNQYQPKPKSILANTLKESVLQPASKQNNEPTDITKKSTLVKEFASILPNNSAVHKQSQIQRQLHLQQQQIEKIQGNSKNKRIVLAAGSSHFRHSSNTVKKQLLAQASNGVIQSANQKSGQQGLLLLNNVIAAAAVASASVERERPKESAKERPSDQFTQYRLLKQAAAAQGGSYDSSALTTASSKPISYSETQGSPVKLVKGNPALTQNGTVAGKKLLAKPLVQPQLNGGYYAKAQRGIDEFNKELQSIIEKEKQLTDEIIKNSLVKPNGRFNFEALAHLNEIIESKKNIKKRFGIEGLAVNKADGLQKVASTFGINGNIQDEESEDAMEILEKVQAPPNLQNEASDFPLPPLFPGLLDPEGRKRISDTFLKNHYGIQKGNVDESKVGNTTVEEQYMKLVQSLQNSAEKLSQRSQNQPNVASNPSPPGKKLKKKKDQQQQQQTSDQQAQPKPKTTNPNKCRIKIYHNEDHSMKHIQDHPINKAIQKINYIIRLIFKSQGNTRNEASQGTGGQIPPGTSTDVIKIMKGPNETNGFQTGNATQTSLQQHQIEEQRLQEIQRVALKWFNLQIPLKRLEISKAAIREYFQSREFLHLLKTKISLLLFGTINKHNKMTDLVLQFQQQQQLLGLQFQRFYVAWGNNDPIVRQVLKTRAWWQQCNTEDFNEVSFLWTPWKKQQHIDYLYGDAAKSTARTKKGPKTAEESLNNSVVGQEDGLLEQAMPILKNSVDRGFKIYNRMEQNKQLTNKKGVFLNMREYYYMIGEDPFDVLPLTFLIKPKSSQGEADFQRFSMYFQEIATQIKRNDRARQIESDHRIRQIRFELQKKRKEEQKKKAFQETFAKGPMNAAGDKKNNKAVILMNRALPQKQSKKKLNQQSQDPDTSDQETTTQGSPQKDDANTDDEKDIEKRLEEEKRIIESDEVMKEIKERYPFQRNIWIVKPGENTNRGQGIEVCSDLNEIRNIVMNGPGTVQNAGGHTQDQTFIIQKYIDNPLLIHGRKFDFRCYGLMTSINGHLKGYFYEDAYIRTSCKEFDIEDVHNKFIHLTNDAVQKYSNDYGKYENGNKLSLTDFQKYLRQVHPHLNIDVFKHIVPQIRKLITDSYRSVYGKIDPSRLHNTFEMFGYDFMLDEDFRLYLIEVNTNPCLEMTCPLLARIIPEVIDNTFRIVLDPIFPQPESYISRKTSQVPSEVKYTLVFDEDIDGPELLKLRTDQCREGGMGGDAQNGGKSQAIAIIDEIESDEEDDLREAECAIPSPSKMPPIQQK